MLSVFVFFGSVSHTPHPYSHTVVQSFRVEVLNRSYLLGFQDQRSDSRYWIEDGLVCRSRIQSLRLYGARLMCEGITIQGLTVKVQGMRRKLKVYGFNLSSCTVDCGVLSFWKSGLGEYALILKAIGFGVQGLGFRVHSEVYGFGL